MTTITFTDYEIALIVAALGLATKGVGTDVGELADKIIEASGHDCLSDDNMKTFNRVTDDVKEMFVFHGELRRPQ